MIDDIDIRLLESREPSRFADLISEVFSPPIVVVALLTAVSLHASPDLPSALGWIALTTTFCAGVPFLLLLRAVRGGHLPDRHLVRRVDRGTPLAAALLSVLAGCVLLRLLAAPRSITCLVMAFIMGLATMLPLTVRWKLSMHVAVLGGSLTVCLIEFATVWPLIFAPTLPLIAWSRIRSGRHTISQVIGGAVVGVGVAWSVLSFMTTG